MRWRCSGVEATWKVKNICRPHLAAVCMPCKNFPLFPPYPPTLLPHSLPLPNMAAPTTHHSRKKKLGSYPTLLVVFSITLALVVIGLFGLLLVHAHKLSEVVRENLEEIGRAHV